MKNSQRAKILFFVVVVSIPIVIGGYKGYTDSIKHNVAPEYFEVILQTPAGVEWNSLDYVGETNVILACCDRLQPNNDDNRCRKLVERASRIAKLSSFIVVVNPVDLQLPAWKNVLHPSASSREAFNHVELPGVCLIDLQGRATLLSMNEASQFVSEKESEQEEKTRTELEAGTATVSN